MNIENIKVLKLLNGDEIVCEIVEENSRRTTVMNPIILNHIRMPAGRLLVESYVMSPWTAFTADEFYDIQTRSIIVSSKPKETLLDNYKKFIEARENDTVEELQEDFEGGDASNTVGDVLDKLLEKFEESTNDELPRKTTNGHTIH
jgi:hypothetical protein